MAQKADAIIYSIYYVDRAFYSRGGIMLGGGGGEAGLRKMSEETGGHVFTVSNKHPLSEVFQEIRMSCEPVFHRLHANQCDAQRLISPYRNQDR